MIPLSILRQSLRQRKFLPAYHVWGGGRFLGWRLRRGIAQYTSWWRRVSPLGSQRTLRIGGPRKPGLAAFLSPRTSSCQVLTGNESGRRVACLSTLCQGFCKGLQA